MKLAKAKPKHGTDEYYRQYISDWDERHIRNIEFEKNPFQFGTIHYEALQSLRNIYNKMLKEDVDVFQNVENQKWMIYCKEKWCRVKLAELTTERPKFSMIQLNEIYYQSIHKPHSTC